MFTQFTIDDVRRMFKTAHDLACAFGHTWAAVPEETLQEFVRTKASVFLDDTLEAVAKEITGWVYQNLPPGPLGYGIAAPSVNGCIITHTTGTGRTYWSIAHDGFMVQVLRPGDLIVVHALWHMPSGELSQFYLTGLACPRHILALRDVCIAVGLPVPWGSINLADLHQAVGRDLATKALRVAADHHSSYDFADDIREYDIVRDYIAEWKRGQ